MVKTALMGFFAGLIAANGVPHFVSGITRRPYPNVLGRSHAINLVAGWAAFVLAALLIFWSDIEAHPVEAGVFGAIGVLAISLFHAFGGALLLSPAFGKVEFSPKEYLSQDWLDAVRAAMESGLASVDLGGVDFTYSEEVTQPPARLSPRGRSLGWHFLLRDGRISVGAGPLVGASAAVIADYAVLRFLQRFEVAGLPDRREELARLHKAFGARGDFHVDGEERLAALPAHVLEKLIPLHDRIAAVTA